MKLEYDPEKSRRNAEQRGLPFDRAYDLDWRTARTLASPRSGEERYLTAAYLNDRLHMLCYLPIMGGLRVISLRKAKQKEADKYGLQLKRVS